MLTAMPFSRQSKTAKGIQIMLRILAALVAATNLVCAADDLSLKALTQKALDEEVAKAPMIRLDRMPQEPLICAIPLKEVRAGAGNHIDPITRPTGPVNFDRIARPAPIQACPGRW